MTERPGFLFMFGIYGTRASAETVSFLKETGACGVLLLARNIESPAQTRRLVDELQDRVGRPLLFAVDHEGGWVLRFAKGLTAFPGNAALGRTGDAECAYAVGRHMAIDLKALGIRMNLAPVLDVLTDRYNPGVGIRSFGKDPSLAGRLGRAMIRGMQDHGVSACAKHFPGKGAARQDAHVTLPTIRIPAREFRARHLAPFAEAVRGGVQCVMTSHVRFPALDASGACATFSPKITGALLRRELRFRGVVICDDLCMGAVTEHLPIQRAAARALEAGHDILLVAHEPRTQREAWELVENAADQGLIDISRIRESSRRIRALMARHHRASLDAAAPTGGPALAGHIARRAVELVQAGEIPLPLPIGPASARNERFLSGEAGRIVEPSTQSSFRRLRIVALIPNFTEVQDRFTFEDGPKGPEDHLHRQLAKWPARTEIVSTPINRNGSMTRNALRRTRGADIVIFFCFEAMRFPGQMETLRRLQASMRRRLVVCLIRNSWDRSLLKPGVTALDGYGYRNCTMAALVDALYPPAAREVTIR